MVHESHGRCGSFRETGLWPMRKARGGGAVTPTSATWQQWQLFFLPSFILIAQWGKTQECCLILPLTEGKSGSHSSLAMPEVGQHLLQHQHLANPLRSLSRHVCSSGKSAISFLSFSQMQPGESWWPCNCTEAVCISNDTWQLIPKVCKIPPEPECSNGLLPVLVEDEDKCCWHWECDCKFL